MLFLKIQLFLILKVCVRILHHLQNVQAMQNYMDAHKEPLQLYKVTQPCNKNAEKLVIPVHVSTNIQNHSHDPFFT